MFLVLSVFNYYFYPCICSWIYNKSAYFMSFWYKIWICRETNNELWCKVAQNNTPVMCRYLRVVLKYSFGVNTQLFSILNSCSQWVQSHYRPDQLSPDNIWSKLLESQVLQRCSFAESLLFYASLVMVMLPLIHSVSMLLSDVSLWEKSNICCPSTNTRNRLCSQWISICEETRETRGHSDRCRFTWWKDLPQPSV